MGGWFNEAGLPVAPLCPPSGHAPRTPAIRAVGVCVARTLQSGPGQAERTYRRADGYGHIRREDFQADASSGEARTHALSICLDGEKEYLRICGRWRSMIISPDCDWAGGP